MNCSVAEADAALYRTALRCTALHCTARRSAHSTRYYLLASARPSSAACGTAAMPNQAPPSQGRPLCRAKTTFSFSPGRPVFASLRGPFDPRTARTMPRPSLTFSILSGAALWQSQALPGARSPATYRERGHNPPLPPTNLTLLSGAGGSGTLRRAARPQDLRGRLVLPSMKRAVGIVRLHPRASRPVQGSCPRWRRDKGMQRH